jgi:ribose-phosphate pyrophosphokinase
MENSHYIKTQYPDGSSYVTIKDFVDSFTYRINSYEDLWTLQQIRDAYRFNGKNASVTIPNLFDAQADRRFNPNESHGLKLVCQFINNMNWEKVIIFHPHNQEVVESLIDSVRIIDNSYFIKEVLSEIYCEVNNVERDLGSFYHLQKELFENLILLSSDAGGFKPLMKLCDKIKWEGETYSASKSRQHSEGQSKLIQHIDRQDFQGKDILIVDDMSLYGGTFKGLSKMLKERNCGKLYLAVSHMTIQNLGEDPITDYFDKVFTTNSKYDKYESTMWTDLSTRGNKNLEIIKCF